MKFKAGYYIISGIPTYLSEEVIKAMKRDADSFVRHIQKEKQDNDLH